MNEDQHDASSKPPDWRVDGDEQLETSAYHVWKPRPLLRSVHWKPSPAGPKDAAAGSYDVFIDQRVFSAVHQHLWGAAPGEAPFGFLVGDLCEDPDTGRRYVIVSAAIPSKFPFVEEGPTQVPGEAVVAMQLEVDRRRGVLAGWYHRHGSGVVELTAEDVQTHEKHFPEPWHVALLFVTDFAQPAGACFRRTRHGFAPDTPLPFFEMVSNESLLAKGVRRSHMDWVNVETVDSVELDPLFRPEPSEEAMPAAGEAAKADRPFDDETDEALTPVSPGVEEDTEAIALEAEPDLGTSLEDGPSAIEAEQAETDRESADVGLTLPVLEEFEAEEPELEDEVDSLPEPGWDSEDAADEVDSLPEPGWDSEDAADEVSVPPVEDVDLDAFVTEVETADVAAQVDGPLEPEDVEPDWDELPAEEPPSDEMSLLEVAAELGIDDEPAVSLVDAAGDVAEPEPEPLPAAIPEPPEDRPSVRRPRNRFVLVAGLLAVAAIVTSLLVFGLPSDSGSDSGITGMEAAPVVEGQGPEDAPVDDAPIGDAPFETDEAAGEESLDSPPPADSVPAPVSAVELEQLGDVLLESISRYYGRAVALDGGQATCTDLQAAYVEVEDRWISYNVQGRARFRGRLPEELATRDERLYSGVQDVEREFTRSGCDRP